jgi:hypothetical protein
LEGARILLGESHVPHFQNVGRSEKGLTTMHAAMSLVYIPCEIKEGMFSTEYAVTVRDLSGESVSFFADRGLVKEGQRPLLRVRFLGPSENPATGIVVMLPGSAMDAERRYLRVREDDVVAA